jgi:hypothetical protein
VSKERAKNRAAREREAGIKAAARGSEKERQEREQVTRKAPAKKSAGKQARPPASAGKPRPAARPRPAAAKKRGHAPVGRPDGPLARRRRFRVRLLLVLLLAVNVATWVIWRDWSVTLAVLIVSVITAPLLAALLLRRR